MFLAVQKHFLSLSQSDLTKRICTLVILAVLLANMKSGLGKISELDKNANCDILLKLMFSKAYCLCYADLGQNGR